MKMHEKGINNYKRTLKQIENEKKLSTYFFAECKDKKSCQEKCKKCRGKRSPLICDTKNCYLCATCQTEKNEKQDYFVAITINRLYYSLLQRAYPYIKDKKISKKDWKIKTHHWYDFKRKDNTFGEVFDDHLEYLKTNFPDFPADVFVNDIIKIRNLRNCVDYSEKIVPSEEFKITIARAKQLHIKLATLEE